MTYVTNAIGPQGVQSWLKRGPPGSAPATLRSGLGPVIVAALLAAVTANGFARHYGPRSANPAASEPQGLAIAPTVQDSQAGVHAAAPIGITPSAVQPEKRAKADSRISTPAAVDTTPVRIDGIVGPDLNQSLSAAGVPAAVSADYIHALASRIDLSRGISVADRFDLVIAHRQTAGDEEFGRLLYAGLDRVGASDLELVRWSVAGRPDWIDANGETARTAGMVWPVAEHISSSFGMRMHPLLGYVRFHRGVDLRASWGTPIVAAADGQIATAGWQGGYGRLVRILHPGGIETIYGHMSRIAAVPGQRVRQGQVIGYVGSSGLSTGPHLHYEVTRNGRPVDPVGVGMAGATRTDPHDRQAMRSALRQLLLLKERA